MTRYDIPGWFPHENEVALQTLVEEHGIQTVVEIGAYLGRSTAFFRELPLIKHIVVIDPFVMWPEGRGNGDAMRDGGEDFYDKFVANMDALQEETSKTPNVHLARLSVVHKTSKEACEANPELVAQMIFIDATHSYESVKEDIQLWLPRATKIICGDDYDENWPGVKQAVNELLPDRIIIGRVWYKII